MKFLAIDVGMGTQDILLYDSNKRVENCIKMVLPSRTQIVADQINEATRSAQDIVLTGETMGGGPSGSAIRQHLNAALQVFATEKAALTLNDDLEKVKRMGIILVKDSEVDGLDAKKIQMQDIDRSALEKALGSFGVKIPVEFAIAVQDHGYSPGMSNRVFRFEYFEDIIKKRGDLDSFVYRGNIPQRFSRMKAVERTLPGALLMDTGMAAVRGALLDEKARSPHLVINIGNGHTFACVVDDRRILSMFEHHTHQMTAFKIEEYLIKMCNGTLSFQDIFEDGGHGCYIKETVGFDNINSILVTGPNRSIMQKSKLDIHFAAPFGDMMLTGSFGLMDAYIKSISN